MKRRDLLKGLFALPLALLPVKARAKPIEWVRIGKGHLGPYFGAPELFTFVSNEPHGLERGAIATASVANGQMVSIRVIGVGSRPHYVAGVQVTPNS